MKKWMLLLTLCISLLLSGCQKTPEAQPGTPAGGSAVDRRTSGRAAFL